MPMKSTNLLVFSACILAVTAGYANEVSGDTQSTSCSDSAIQIQKREAVSTQPVAAPWIYRKHDGFEIRIPISAARHILSTRIDELSEKGLSTAGPERLLERIRSSLGSASQINLSTQGPNPDAMSQAWEAYRNSPGYQDPDSYLVSEYYRLSLHQYEPVALITRALQLGLADVADETGAHVPELIRTVFEGPDGDGNAVFGVDFMTPDGRRVFHSCVVDPGPGESGSEQ